jgi:hypothetical protein
MHLATFEIVITSCFSMARLEVIIIIVFLICLEIAIGGYKLMQEHDIQNAIRVAISENNLGVSFRCNVGQAWTGERIIRNPDGSITIIHPRPFNTGLPDGFTDLLVIQPIGSGARPAFIEVKTKTGRVRPAQLHFIEQMQSLGAKAGVARSPDDALKILKER